MGSTNKNAKGVENGGIKGNEELSIMCPTTVIVHVRAKMVLKNTLGPSRAMNIA